MSTATPCIQPIQELRRRCMITSAWSRCAGRHEAADAVEQRVGVHGDVVRGDQDQDQDAEHAGQAQADRGDRADQLLRIVGVVLRELLHPVGDLARLRAGDVVDLVAQVVDDARHVVHELVRLVDERAG